MSEDATLDAFAESNDESTESADAGVDESTVNEDGSTDGQTASADRIPVTSSWAATASCPDCGDEVARLWQDGDARVCAACKTWRARGDDPCDR